MSNTLFEWPTPPFYSYVKKDEPSDQASCAIYFNNGNKIIATLLQFVPETSVVVVLHQDQVSSQTINLEYIKSIQLLKPQSLESDHQFLEELAHEDLAPVERQTYSVEFSDKELILGYTLGYIDTELGLYLYPITKSNQVAPCFITRHSIKSYKIGEKLGEILQKEKLASSLDIDEALKQQSDLRVQRLGDYLSDHEIISVEQLKLALQHQEKLPILRLGEALLQLNLLSEEQLNEALEKQKKNRQTPLGQILIQMGVIDEQSLKGAMASKLGIPYVTLGKFDFDLNATRLISAKLAKQEMIVPLCIYKQGLVIALENPMNTKIIDHIRFMTQMKTMPAMASREDIINAINTCYSEDGNLLKLSDYNQEGVHSDEMGIDDLATKLFSEESEEHIEETSVTESDNTLVQLVNKMILDAYRDGVSDIHIETYADKKNTKVRFRKDGSLVPYLEIPSNFRNALISRIKIMSQLDISERRKPQDGKLDFKQFGPAKIELRIATIPTSNGLEDVVMRVLAAAKPVPIDNLGLDSDKLAALKKLASRPYGLILVCGPTGSGKTTTLHSVLGHINTEDRKIWTAEDPVEITQAGLRQVQVNPKIGWTFAAAMRSFLRADPDVIMVGEMRDKETTHIGIEASLTGHLVLSTLHTNSAPESITRMLDLGMDPFNFADALLAILAQRLAKTLCSECKVAYTPDEAELAGLAAEYCEGSLWQPQDIMQAWQQEHGAIGKLTLHQAKGCSKCNNTGYKGRMGLYEFMEINSSLKRLIQNRAPVTDLLHEALAQGMRTLKQDGIGKILQGKTDIAQVRAVCV